MKTSRNNIIQIECKGGIMKPYRGRLEMACTKKTQCRKTSDVVAPCIECENAKIDILDLKNNVLATYKKPAVKKPAKRKKGV